MQIKLIIWDLDDTLWRGTLADGEAVVLNEGRADLVRAFNARGVVSSICSKNERAAAQAQLETMGLWDQFVFAHIDFTPKAEAVRQIIADMQLRPANVLFVDDNPQNLAAVRHALPEIHGLDALADDADAVLEALLAAQPEGARSRLADYRMLEARALDRKASNATNEAFLRQSAIRVCAPFNMDSLDFVERIAELINRSNQLNYTSSRVETGALAEAIMDVAAHDSWSVFAWDRYGDYGLVGFVMLHRREKRLVHFTFSCRAMHMGLENFMLTRVFGKEPTCDISVLGDRVGAPGADWIEDVGYDGADVRDRLIAQLRPAAVGDHDVRIMFDCQSGGLAHFSRMRARIDFDNSPRVFSLCHVVTKADEDPGFAPTLVYGAGVDYADARWPELADLLEDDGLFEGCVHLFCEKVVAAGSRMLVVLPPEDAAEIRYRPHFGQRRSRIIAFNAIWRDAAAAYPGIELFELTGFIRLDEIADISHFYAGFLQRMAGVIDDWVDGVGLPVARAA